MVDTKRARVYPAIEKIFEKFTRALNKRGDKTVYFKEYGPVAIHLLIDESGIDGNIMNNRGEIILEYGSFKHREAKEVIKEMVADTRQYQPKPKKKGKK